MAVGGGSYGKRCLRIRWLLMLSLASALGAVAAGQARSQDPYEVLGLRRGASEDEIRRAYRQIAVKDHPDKKPGDASARERFLQAKEAYSILMDPNSNKRFDGHTQDDHSRESRRGRTKRATWESGESGTGLESGTVELNKHTLMALALKSGETWLVYVYAEGCMECASEIPAWEAAADALTGVARLGRISATAEPTVAGRLTNLHFLPSVIGFGPACTRLSCGVRLKGRITSKRLVEFASGLANLPLIRTLPSCPVDTWSILSSGVAPDRLATAAVHVPTGSNRPSAQVRASANSAPGVSVFACATENDSSVGRIDIARPDVERVVRAEVKSERHEIDRLLLAHGVELVPELHSNSALSKQLAAPGLSVLVVALSPNNGLQIADKLGDILVQHWPALSGKSDMEDGASDALAQALHSGRIVIARADPKRQRPLAATAGVGSFDQAFAALAFHDDSLRPSLPPRVLPGDSRREKVLEWMVGLVEAEAMSNTSQSEWPLHIKPQRSTDFLRNSINSAAGSLCRAAALWLTEAEFALRQLLTAIEAAASGRIRHVTTLLAVPAALIALALGRAARVRGERKAKEQARAVGRKGCLAEMGASWRAALSTCQLAVVLVVPPMPGEAAEVRRHGTVERRAREAMKEVASKVIKPKDTGIRCFVVDAGSNAEWRESCRDFSECADGFPVLGWSETLGRFERLGVVGGGSDNPSAQAEEVLRLLGGQFRIANGSNKH